MFSFSQETIDSYISPVVAVTVRHGEDVGIEDTVARLKGEDGVLTLVMFTATTVCLRKHTCDGYKEKLNQHQVCQLGM